MAEDALRIGCRARRAEFQFGSDDRNRRAARTIDWKLGVAPTVSSAAILKTWTSASRRCPRPGRGGDARQCSYQSDAAVRPVPNPPTLRDECINNLAKLLCHGRGPALARCDTGVLRGALVAPGPEIWPRGGLHHGQRGQFALVVGEHGAHYDGGVRGRLPSHRPSRPHGNPQGIKLGARLCLARTSLELRYAAGDEQQAFPGRAFLDYFARRAGRAAISTGTSRFIPIRRIFSSRVSGMTRRLRPTC